MQLSILDAIQSIFANVSSTQIELIPLEQALYRVCAHTLKARYSLPNYDNSAMDGYLVKISDAGKKVTVETEIFAGDSAQIKLLSGNAIKTMTGAPIALEGEAIVPIEEITAIDKKHIQLPATIKAGQHIRLCGEDVQKESTLLTKGTKLYAHHIALLASQGVSHLKVYKQPRIAVFASGNELKLPHEPIEAHQLYNTNSPALLARAQELHASTTFIGSAQDSLQSIQSHISSALDADLIITTGGVSVGDADFTKEAFASFNYRSFFDKIAIKPGKPTQFGKIDATYVLNLPGNPLAAMMIFELFGTQIIHALSGRNDPYLATTQTVMATDCEFKAGRQTLIPGSFNGNTFEPLKKLAPGMVAPLARANAYLITSHERSAFQEGETVHIIVMRQQNGASSQQPLFN